MAYPRGAGCTPSNENPPPVAKVASTTLPSACWKPSVLSWFKSALASTKAKSYAAAKPAMVWLYEFKAVSTVACSSGVNTHWSAKGTATPLMDVGLLGSAKVPIKSRLD